jgi:hypothetical protein
MIGTTSLRRRTRVLENVGATPKRKVKHRPTTLAINLAGRQRIEAHVTPRPSRTFVYLAVEWRCTNAQWNKAYASSPH